MVYTPANVSLMECNNLCGLKRCPFTKTIGEPTLKGRSPILNIPLVRAFFLWWNSFGPSLSSKENWYTMNYYCIISAYTYAIRNKERKRSMHVVRKSEDDRSSKITRKDEYVFHNFEDENWTLTRKKSRKGWNMHWEVSLFLYNCVSAYKPMISCCKSNMPLRSSGVQNQRAFLWGPPFF